SESSPRRHQMV
ncbi:hypothetical protein AB1N83_013921, partial [Pleurotus pulmonarius]